MTKSRALLLLFLGSSLALPGFPRTCLQLLWFGFCRKKRSLFQPFFGSTLLIQRSLGLFPFLPLYSFPLIIEISEFQSAMKPFLDFDHLFSVFCGSPPSLCSLPFENSVPTPIFFPTPPLPATYHFYNTWLFSPWPFSDCDTSPFGTPSSALVFFIYPLESSSSAVR